MVVDTFVRAGCGSAGCGVVGTVHIVRTVILDSDSAGLDDVLERRRRSGLDRLDEMWGGVLHMIPAPSFEHARVAQQLAVLLDGPARAAGLDAAPAELADRIEWPTPSAPPS